MASIILTSDGKKTEYDKPQRFYVLIVSLWGAYWTIRWQQLAVNQVTD